MQLESFTTAELFAFLLIFVRTGTGVMFLPGFGEGYVTPRARLLLALFFALVLMPALQPVLPAIPKSPLALTVLLAGEITVGAFLGLLIRVMVSAMHTAGMIISYQSSLSTATMFDMTQATQGTAIGNFLSLTAVTLLFVTNSHHLMLMGLFDSYSVFPAGGEVALGDMSDSMSRMVGDAFLMAIKLSAPLIVVGLVSFLGMGVLARLMPTMQVFFVIVSPQILVSFALLMSCLSGMMLWYLEFAEEHFNAFIR